VAASEPGETKSVAKARDAYHAGRVTTFVIEDAGDGWWHCPSPLSCVVIDGPSPWFGPRDGARWPETYWLVRTKPPIEWHGQPEFAARWGPHHPLCLPIAPTPYALVMASSPWTGPIDVTAAGVPAYPVVGAPSRVADARPIEGLGMKVALRS
jgi:hypothetical protein